MTQKDLFSLKGEELSKALLDQETFQNVKVDPTLLSHVLDALPEDSVAEIFVGHKFAPKKAVTKYPTSFIKQFIERSFNPGTDGLLELCALSRSSQMDKIILEVIKAFPSNKYDAGFIRSVMNLYGGNDLILAETLAYLLSTSSVRLILLEELKNNSPKTFLELIFSLEGELKDSAAQLLNPSLVRKHLSKDPEENLRFFKFLCQMNGKIRIGSFFKDENAYYEDFFKGLFLKKSTYARITDDEAMLYFRHLLDVRNRGPFGLLSSDGKVAYRPVYEELPNEIVGVLKDIPKQSRFYILAFKNGRAKLSPEEAFEILKTWGNNASAAHMLSSVLASGNEISELIESNPEVFLTYLERHSLKPAVLRDAVKSGGVSVARVILPLVGTEYRRQLLAAFPELKSKTQKVGIPERHASLCDLIRDDQGEEFLNEILSYEDGINSHLDGIRKFLARHEQATYKKKYETMVLSFKFLASLKDEEAAMKLIFSDIKTRSGWGTDKKGSFLSAKNALLVLREEKEDVTDALTMTYERDQFLDALTAEELSGLRFYEFEDEEEGADTISTLENIKRSAKNLVKKLGKKVSKERLSPSEATLKAAASELTKAQAMEFFEISPVQDVDLIFKSGERFTAEDILSQAAKSSSGYQVEDVIKALKKIDAKEEVIRVCQAVIHPKTDAFNSIFPEAGKRSNELREKATQVLSEYGENHVDVSHVLKKEKNFTGLKRLLGPDFIELLCKHEPSRKLTLVMDYTQDEIKKGDLERLQAKYDLTCPVVSFTNGIGYRKIKYASDLEIPISGIEIYSLDSEKTSLEKMTKEVISIALSKKIPITCTHPRWSSGNNNLLEVARLEGCRGILSSYSIEALRAFIKDKRSLKLAQELDIPISGSSQVAELVARDVELLKTAIKEQIHFDDFLVAADSYQLEQLTPFLKEAQKIGLRIVSSEEFEFIEIFEHVFNEDGTIRDFEPVSLANLTLSQRLDVIERLVEKNPKYKKLLSQSVGDDRFMLNPPKLLEKSILSLSTLKENLGFGIPGDLSKEEKESLSEYLVAHSTFLSLAHKNLRNLLSIAGLSEVYFSDFFTRHAKGVQTSEMALFFATRYTTLDPQASELFATIIKEPSRTELLALVKDGEEYTYDFLKDSVESFTSVRSALNEFVALLGETDVTASLIFRAMAGDPSAIGLLSERMERSDDAAEMLKDLSNNIKRVTVEVSIARAQSKEGKEINLARCLHDLLGELYKIVRSICKSKGEGQRKKIKSGFERFNGLLSKAEMRVPSKVNSKQYSIFFPENLSEVQKAGSENHWCTSYHDNYFNDMIGGTAILFNLKDGDEICVQGFIVGGQKGWKMSQLRYGGRGQPAAERDFDLDLLVERVTGLIERDEKLKERYKF